MFLKFTSCKLTKSKLSQSRLSAEIFCDYFKIKVGGCLTNEHLMAGLAKLRLMSSPFSRQFLETQGEALCSPVGEMESVRLPHRVDKQYFHSLEVGPACAESRFVI